jgi:hypothetical protein
MHLKVKIDVTKIDKSALYVGAKGTYLNLVLLEKREVDKYGNTHGVKQDLGVARKGEQSVFLGDAGPMGKGITPQASQDNDDNDDIPF